MAENVEFSGAWEGDDDVVPAAGGGDESEEDYESGLDGEQSAKTSANAEKKIKKKRKIEELKAKKQAKREADLAIEHEIVIPDTLSPEDQLSLIQSSAAMLSITLDTLDDSLFLSASTAKLAAKKACRFSSFITTGLPHFKSQLKSKHPSLQSKGSPAVLIVCAGARRASDVINTLSHTFHCMIGKLYAKHFKIQEQVDFLSQQCCPIAVGTPNRLSKLAEYGALHLEGTKLVLVDLQADSKAFNMLTMHEVKTDFFEFLCKYIVPEKDHLKLMLVPHKADDCPAVTATPRKPYTPSLKKAKK